MDKQPKYQCSKCSLAVIVMNGETITACDCNATITANMSATLKGAGKVSA